MKLNEEHQICDHIRARVFLLIPFFGLSLSFVLSRTIPNTLSLLHSSVSNQVSFKAAGSFQQLPTEEQPLNLEQLVSDPLDMQTNETDRVDEPQQSFYRVRKDWVDKKSQIGAFAKKENALELAKKNSGYKVYDPLGNEMNDLDLSNKRQTQQEIKSIMLY